MLLRLKKLYLPLQPRNSGAGDLNGRPPSLVLGHSLMGLDSTPTPSKRSRNLSNRISGFAARRAKTNGV